MTFPNDIDNTMRQSFVVCPEQFRRAHIQHLGPQVPSVHLHFGGCMAKGLEVARRWYYSEPTGAASYIRMGQEAAVHEWADFDPPGGSYKTLDTLAESIRYYFETWPLDADTTPPNIGADGKPEVEWWFRLPIPGVTHPDHGGPIYAVGRSDFIPNMGGLLGIADDKSASSLGASWAKQWELDSQFSQYAWARREQGHAVEYILVRGISILKPKWTEIVDPAGTETNKKGQPIRREYNRAESFGHAQALVYRPQWMVDRWLAQLQRDVKRMVSAYVNDEWDFALHKGACEAYGGCTFRSLCTTQDPERWVPVNFVERVWNPLAHV
jgi:hypothetical protein